MGEEVRRRRRWVGAGVLRTRQWGGGAMKVCVGAGFSGYKVEEVADEEVV